MSTTLTGLAGDIASFYNITQDEAYTKLKAVFTGETEALKELGTYPLPDFYRNILSITIYIYIFAETIAE